MRTYMQKSRMALAALGSLLATALVLAIFAAPALARSASPELAGHEFGVPLQSGGAAGFVPSALIFVGFMAAVMLTALIESRLERRSLTRSTQGLRPAPISRRQAHTST